MSAPTWAYDALRMCRGLEQPGGGATAAEVQIFAYLACLMWVYDGRQASDWGYTFSATPAGSPYARDLAATTDRLRARGLIVDRLAPRYRPNAATAAHSANGRSRSPEPRVLGVSPVGASELAALATLQSCSLRERYLEAATSAARLMPLPAITDAVTYEPGLRQALRRTAKTELLDTDGVTVVREQFEVVIDALRTHENQGEDLLVPTVIWVGFLAETAETDRRAA